MSRSVKDSGGGLAVQVTYGANKSGLAVQKSGMGHKGADRWERLATTRLYGFDELALAIDKKMEEEHIAELVATAARATDSIYKGRDASIRPAGNGVMISLPGVEEAGFQLDDDVYVEWAPDMLIMAPVSDWDRGLIDGLISLRETQVGD